MQDGPHPPESSHQKGGKNLVNLTKPDGQKLKRYAPPNKLDTWPKGTICEVVNSQGLKSVYYEQVSGDEEHPHWELMD
jgi:hypothetical protein